MNVNDFSAPYTPEVPLDRQAVRPTVQPAIKNPWTDTAKRTATGTTPGAVGPFATAGDGAAGNDAPGPVTSGRESAGHMARAAGTEAHHIARDLGDEGSRLFSTLGDEVRNQASMQQRRVTTTLREISDEFAWMLHDGSANGLAGNVVERATVYSANAADWLDGRDPGNLVQETKRFAKRHPAAFLGIALGAGLVAGRLTRNAGEGASAREANDARTGRTPVSAERPRNDSAMQRAEGANIGGTEPRRTEGNLDVGGKPSGLHGPGPGFSRP
ncbi:hypothetical protein ACIPUB_17650 [Paeniglutamicibacter sp. ORCA_105]|uniref:hypothetical protein n=1 Tax=Paeniglutamicibacter sp. ORCA_105 TaxID=3377336 RepID=UPI003894E324